MGFPLPLRIRPSRALAVVLAVAAAGLLPSGCFRIFTHRDVDGGADADTDSGVSVDADGPMLDGGPSDADLGSPEVGADGEADVGAHADADEEVEPCIPVMLDGWTGSGDGCMGATYEPGERSWPVATDADGPEVDGVPGCTNSGGGVAPSVGGGAAPWFGYWDCGSWKELLLGEGCSLTVVTTNDCCETCAIRDIRYRLEVDRGSGWERVTTVRHDFDATAGPGGNGCVTHVEHFDRATLDVEGVARIRLADGAGYACAYQE